MNEDGYCICEICIRNCHAGHKTYLTKEFDEGFGPGFCDCGDEGSQGIRTCKIIKGMIIKQLLPLLTEAGAYPQLPTQPNFFLIIFKLIQQSIMVILSCLAKKNQNLNSRKKSSVYY